MKYINKEYGFEGRPPFFNDFYEESSKLLYADKIVNKVKPTVGFGLDKNVLNGALLAGGYGNMWGLKFNYQQPGGKWVEDNDFLLDSGRYFAGDTNDKFRYMCHGDLMVSMVKYSQNAVVLSFSTLSRLRLKLTFYCLTPYEQKMSRENDTIYAKAKEKGVIKGDVSINDTDTVIRSRYAVLYNESSAKIEEAVCSFIYNKEATFDETSDGIIFETEINEENQRVMVYLAVGNDGFDKEIPGAESLTRGVNNRELSYSVKKVSGSGKLANDAGEIINACSGFKIYNPYRLSNYYIDSRDNLNNHYAFDPTEAATAGLISALIDDVQIDQLQSYAGDIIMGAISVWVAFCRTRNKRLLSEAYPKWMLRWQLDTNLISVNPYTMREIGYKMPLSPLKDIKSQKLFSLEFNTYKLLALDVMERAARILNKSEKVKIKTVYNEFKQKFNAMFFNNRLGLYMDRYESGDFTINVGVTSFLPLVAGAVEDNDSLDMLLINLKDSKKFGFSCPVPTISKDNPNYNKFGRHQDGSISLPYEDYRGSVIPYFNYLVYLGLTRVGAIEHSAELAIASANIRKSYFEAFGSVPSIIHPNLKLDTKAHKKSLSGNLLGLIGISELIDVEYFNDDLRPALRFGTMAGGEHRLTNLDFFGIKTDITISKDSTTLKLNGRTFFEGVGGSFIVRNLKENEDGLEFYIYTKNNLTLTLTTPMFCSKLNEPAYYNFNLEMGKFKVVLKDKLIKTKRI